jgi:hypothetical protein
VNEEALAHWGLSRQKQKYALFGLVSYNESSVHGHESFKIKFGVFLLKIYGPILVSMCCLEFPELDLILQGAVKCVQ